MLEQKSFLLLTYCISVKICKWN